MAIDVEKQTTAKDEAPSGATVGIIYPPPEVRNIVDKTANFVARNGPEFESRIRQNEIGNPKFNFLSHGDPYHSYYQHRVKDIREGKVKDAPPPVPKQPTLATATQQKQQELLKQAATEQPFVPKDPPKEFEFVADPPSIAGLDLDIVKLTAQFVARNGRGFLTSLMQKEQRNFQFDFLRPQHSLFQYFTKLLEQYTKILIPPKDMMFRLKDEASSVSAILEEVKYRADYIRYQEAQRKMEEAKVEKDRMAYAQIDWHDFVVVETVDYMQGEPGNFPPPTTPDEVGARVLMQERMDNGEEEEEEEEDEVEEEYERRPEDDDMQIGSDEEENYYNARMRGRNKARNREEINEDDMQEGTTSEEDSDDEEAKKSKEAKDNTQVEDMEEDSSSEEETDKDGAIPPPPPPPPSIRRVEPAPPLPSSIQPPPLPPAPDKVVVKKGYDPKQARPPVVKPSATDEFLISPITGEKIPASKVQEHMRIGLLDPRWVEQRDKHLHEKINQETVYAPGTAIEASLKQLAERRTDIFGVGDEETAIGKKIGEEETRKDDKVTWDGHTSSVESATRAARANITLEDQIHQIHKVKGLLPDEEKEKIGPKRSHAAPAPPLPRPMPPKPKMQPPPAPPPVLAPPPPPKIMMPPVPAPPPMMMLPPGMMVAPGGFQPGPPPPPGPMPGLPPGFAPPPPPNIGPGPPMSRKHPLPESFIHEDEPMGKKVRSEDTLIPEHMFLANVPSPHVTFNILVPNMPDKPEWKLNGQTLSVSLDLRESVTNLKSNISDLIGMPAGKQKLLFDGIFFKDSNSLAYYNISPGMKVLLQLKERGGRKK